MSDMTVLILTLTLAFCRCINTLPITKDEYVEMREKLLVSEHRMQTGGALNLTDAELGVNAILMNLKRKELDVARGNVSHFPPAVHFFRAKELIDNSDVFKIIRSMPKGRPIIHAKGQYVFTTGAVLKGGGYAPQSEVWSTLPPPNEIFG